MRIPSEFTDHLGFNGAALVRARRGELRQFVLEATPGFNGAALVRARREAHRACLHRQAHCFNGAALVRARRVPLRRQLRRGVRRFNGAALVRARRGALAAAPRSASDALQRSRARESAEGCDLLGHTAPSRLASTEPRS